jgi:LCP family protein required for cell wall assembly
MLRISRWRVAGPRAILLLVVAPLVLSACAGSSPSPSAPTPSPTEQPTPTASPTPEPTATPIPLDQALLSRRVTFLVVGSDSSAYRRQIGMATYRTDAMMVVSVSADHSQIAVLSLPRDTVDVPMADGRIYTGKVNGLAEAYGLAALQGAMGKLLGIHIDSYIKVDMDDFTWMVDAVGGVNVEVLTRIADPKVNLYLQPGPIHLNGRTALSYTRTRADSDYARDGRQQQVVLALFRKWVAPTTSTSLLARVRVLASLQTNIPLAELPTLIEIGRRATNAHVTAIVLQPPRFALFSGFEVGTNRGWVMIPNVGAMRAYAQSLMSG